MSVTLNGTVANIVEVTQNKYVHRVLHTSREEKTIYTYMKSHWLLRKPILKALF